MQSVRESIHVSAPFSLKAVVLSHGWHECSPMSWSEGGRCFQTIDRYQDEVYRVSVTEGAKSRSRIALHVTADGRNLREGLGEWACNLVRRIFDLDRDLSEFYGFCEGHPTLRLVPRIGAGRLIRSPTMFENVVKTISFTNVNWSQAVKMINRVGQIGPTLPHFVHLHAWPGPKEILRAGEPYLRDVCRLGYRVESILAFCRDVQRGGVDLEDLMENHGTNAGAQTSDDILKRLRQIRGVGPTSAHYLLAMIGRYDRLAVDTSTVDFVRRAYFKGKKPTPRQVEEVYAPYGKWKHLVWWFEFWLTWATAKGILVEAGVDPGVTESRARRVTGAA